MTEPGARASPAREVAFDVVLRTFADDAWTDRAFRSAADRHGLGPRDRALAQRLAYGAVQRRGTTDHVLDGLVDRAPGDLDPPVSAALRLGAYEILFASATPDYAAVDQAVALARTRLEADFGARRARAAAGLVNAVLRRVAREGRGLVDRLDDSTPAAAAVRHSYPEWLARMWWVELGAEGTRALMTAMNEPAETAFRVNTARVDPLELADELRAGGERLEVSSEGGDPLWPAEAIVVRGAFGDRVADAIATSTLIPQSRGSQAVVEILDPQPGDRVLDLCAGPGIKTTAIAARMRGIGELRAVERDPRRASQLRDLCQRAGVPEPEIEVADAAEAELGSGYDRVLVDPPCSDLGTLASRPDARWRKSEQLIERLAELQGTLLDRAVGALRPGGRLVYATCTVSERENEALVAGALEHTDAVAADDLGTGAPSLASDRDPRFLQLRPDRHRTDGFFCARLARTR